ncbi:GSCOCG00006162001-RA-CDS [Cotesia congregata]|nr:GSCOCG00006162001-RA-CDS [Cotesia congregata]
MENLSVDPMHEFLEGIYPHDLALIKHEYIYKKKKIFNLQELNDRVQGFNYGSNYNQNKPAEILPHQPKY